MSLSESFESLKKVDLNNLDLNNPGSWPGPVRVIACILLLLLVLVGGYYYHVKELRERLESTIAQEQSLKDQYANKAALAANLDAYKEQMAEMEIQFSELLAKLPADTEVPSLLDDITKIGLGTGLEFQEIKLMPEKTTEFYVELPINISVLGTYHDLASFVSGTSSLQRIVTLHDFEITPEAKNETGSSRLKMNILAKTYRYNDKGAVK